MRTWVKRTGLVKTRVAIAIGAVLLVAIVAKHWTDSRAAGEAHARRTRTIHALNRLQAYLTDHKIVYGTFPGPALRDAIDAIEKDGCRYNEEYGFELTKPGLDAWGREIIYEVRDSDHVIIRSVGENGVDEKGRGDDIQREVPAP